MMMLKGSLVLLSTILVAQCTEFVPVFSWGSLKSIEKVPALHKISQDSFLDAVQAQLKKNVHTVVFAEQTLSSEDFGLKNSQGETAFPYLSELKTDYKVEYLPSVQNPIKALKHSEGEVEEVSIDSLKESLDIPESGVLIIDLNDAKDNEHRWNMLERHDQMIVSIFKKLVEKYENVVAFYTARHNSWVSSENSNNRQRRSLLEAEEDKSNATFSVVNKLAYVYGNVTSDKLSAKNESNTIILTFATEPALSLSFKETDAGYVELVSGDLGGESLLGVSDIYAPSGFSYHCSNQHFKSANKSLLIKDFQIQVFLGNTTNEKFGDAYDCVGFTSAPIWSGLFVTFILLFILTLGLTMMMDIKTMDRFDDAKGKTITINASE